VVALLLLLFEDRVEVALDLSLLGLGAADPVHGGGVPQDDGCVSQGVDLVVVAPVWESLKLMFKVPP
jgi:hypothetical protein